ncbi:hypothetical protein ACWEPC_59085, partial [Nonomuraea sp. NPDC004297]
TRAYTPGLDAALGLVCLHEPGHGTAWVQRDGAVRFTGHPDLAHQLAAHAHGWDAAGRPGISDWSAAFTRSDSEATWVWRPTAWTR